MPNTPAPHNLPYPAAGDPPNGAAQIQALAEAVAARLDVGMPAGTVVNTARATAPSGWLMCDGAAVSRTTYSALFNAIGTLYGGGNGTTTFNVPDARSRVLVGSDNMGSGGAGRTSVARGSVGGEEYHTLTPAETALRYHAHYPGGDSGYFPQYLSGTGVVWHEGTGEARGGSQFTGGIAGGEVNGTAHNNMMPFIGLPAMIKT